MRSGWFQQLHIILAVSIANYQKISLTLDKLRVACSLTRYRFKIAFPTLGCISCYQSTRIQSCLQGTRELHWYIHTVMFVSAGKKSRQKKSKLAKLFFFLSLSLLLEFMFVVCVCTGVFCVFMCECVFDTRRSVTTELIQSMPIFRVWPRYHATDKLPVHRGMMWAESLHWTCTLYHTNTHSHNLLWGYISLDTVWYVCDCAPICVPFLLCVIVVLALILWADTFRKEKNY